MRHMQQTRGASAGPVTRTWARAWSWVLLASVATLFVAWVATGTGGATQAGDTGNGGSPLGFVAGALAVLVAGAGGWLAGHAMGSLRQASALHDTRTEAQALCHLLDVWHWQSDASHHLVRWQPPHAAPASAWAGQAPGTAVWERFTGDGADRLRHTLEHGAAIEGLTLVDNTAQATQRWLLRGLPRHDAQGRFAGYTGTARCLSAEDSAVPAAAAAPRSAHGGDRTADAALESAATASARAVADDAQAFSYTVSHDLRAPLRVVEGFTRILKEDYGASLDRMANDHLDRVLGAAARMNGMIDALLALAKLSSQPLSRQPVNLTQLARYVVEDLQRGAPERQVTVTIEPDLVVHGDPTLLRVVLENLLGNAWKYSSHTHQAHIELASRRQDGEHVFTVSDNGTGFDMRYADRLFGVFQRLHSTSEFPGTGVGLASVKRIVERHGGRIWAESQPGQGTRMHFTLGGAGGA
jgi:signal transduction histidine kinase